MTGWRCWRSASFYVKTHVAVVLYSIKVRRGRFSVSTHVFFVIYVSVSSFCDCVLKVCVCVCLKLTKSAKYPETVIHAEFQDWKIWVLVNSRP